MPALRVKFLLATIWARCGSPWASRRNGPYPMPGVSPSRLMILRCFSPDVEKPLLARRGTCSAPRILGRPGRAWEPLPLPTQPNATMWGLATHPADANRLLAFSLFGEVYISEDAGASWRKIARG